MQIGRYPYYVWLDPYCVVAWISLGIYPGVIYQVNMIVLIWDTSILISIEVKLSYISTRNVQGFLFLYILTKFLFRLVFFVFLMISILMRVKWKLNVTFIKFIFYYFKSCVCTCLCAGVCARECKFLWRPETSGHLELELQAIVN